MELLAEAHVTMQAQPQLKSTQRVDVQQRPDTAPVLQVPTPDTLSHQAHG